MADKKGAVTDAVRGRLHLWSNALRECYELLIHADRAAFRGRQARSGSDEGGAISTFGRGARPVPGRAGPRSLSELPGARKMPFPSSFDLTSVQHRYVMLGIEAEIARKGVA